MFMKLAFKYFFLCLIYFIIVSKVIGQNNDTIESNPFELNNFNLIYGNAGFDIYDFEIINKYKVLLLTKRDGALFVLLDNYNLIIDTLFLKSAPANIKFWCNNDIFYYQSIFFYKSNFCDLDYKPGIASFYVDNDKLIFKGCYSIDDSYIRDELFLTTKNFKITLLEREKKVKKKESKENINTESEIDYIGFAINDKYIVKRKNPKFKSIFNTFFPFVENCNKLYVFDIIENVLYKFNNENIYKIDTLKNTVQFRDTLDNFVSYELLSDEGTKEIYLLATQKSKLTRKGRENQQFEINQHLYKLIEDKWVKINYEIPLFAYKMRIHYKKIYATFSLCDEVGIERKTLYESKSHVF